MTEEPEPIQKHCPTSRCMSEELRKLRKQILQERNGILFADSVEEIHEMREERSNQLLAQGSMI